jgi:hypothetical protein
MGDGEGHHTEFLVHFSPEDEGPLIEEDMPPVAEDLGEEHGLDQALPIIEGRELHRLVLDRVNRLGAGEHAGREDVLAHVA